MNFIIYYRKKALGTAYLIFNQKGIAEDIVQVSFIECFQKIETIKDPEAFEAWFYKILMRTGWKMVKSHNSFLLMNDQDIEGLTAAMGSQSEQAQPGSNNAAITKDDMDKAKEIIAKRLNNLGVSETVVQVDYNKDRIIVDLPGIKDPDQAVDLLKTTAQLTFRDPAGNVVLQGDQLKDARAGQNQDGFVVNLTFTSVGARQFADLTQKYLGQRIGVYLDNKLLTDPQVDTVCSSGQAEIKWYTSLQAAANDAVLMRSGSLPVSLTIVEKHQVGASLGVDSL